MTAARVVRYWIISLGWPPPRGLFYDGHLDRLTLWETEDPTMTLYTCSAPELRACAAGALERGDLILPRLAKKTLDARTEPTRAQDPALILAVAAEQLSKQSELARRRAQTHPVTGDRPDQVLTLTTGHPPAEHDQITRSGVARVVPVAGAHENLDIGRMDTSYTHHPAGPRSRRATTVREHKRRPVGSSPYAQPTITVRAHPRRGT